MNLLLGFLGLIVVTYIILFFIGFFTIARYNFLVFKIIINAKKLNKSISVFPLNFDLVKYFSRIFKSLGYILSFKFKDDDNAEKYIKLFINVEDIKSLNNLEINKDLDKIIKLSKFSSLLLALLFYLFWILAIDVLLLAVFNN